MSEKYTLPTFEELSDLVETIVSLHARKSILDVEIRDAESKVYREATFNPDNFIGGKPPSMTFIENAWKYNGIDGEIGGLRREIADVVTQLDAAKLRLDIYKMVIDIWRTNSANERYTTL